MSAWEEDGMNVTPLNSASDPGTGPAGVLRRARVLNRMDLPHSEIAYELEGDDYGVIGASVIVVDAPRAAAPGRTNTPMRNSSCCWRAGPRSQRART